MTQTEEIPERLEYRCVLVSGESEQKRLTKAGSSFDIELNISRSPINLVIFKRKCFRKQINSFRREPRRKKNSVRLATLCLNLSGEI